MYYLDLGSVRSNICGNNLYNEFIGKFNYLLDHQSTSIILTFSTNLDESPENESFY